MQRRRAFEDRERDKVSEQRKFEESLRDRQMRVRLTLFHRVHVSCRLFFTLVAVFADLSDTLY